MRCVDDVVGQVEVLEQREGGGGGGGMMEVADTVERQLQFSEVWKGGENLEWEQVFP